MKVWMVLALLAMGLGCSEEPPEPWSHSMREVMVDSCMEAILGSLGDAELAFMEEKGVTPRDACRCSLYEMERQHTQSDFLLLSQQEQAASSEKAGATCFTELIGD